MKFDMGNMATVTVRQSGRIIMAPDTQFLDFIRDQSSGLPASQMYNNIDLLAIRAAFIQSGAVAPPPIGEPGISPVENADFQIKSWKQRWTLHNNSNTQNEFTFYFFKPRYAIPNLAGADAAGALARGLVNIIPGVGSAAWTTNTQGCTPFMFSQFTTQYKIYKTVRKVCLPGEQYGFNFIGPKNKTIHCARYRNVTTGTDLIYGEPDKYRGFFIRIIATPVNSDVIKTDVNTAQSAINFTCIENVEVGYNVTQSHKRYYLNTPVGSFRPTLVPLTVVEATGAGVTVAVA